MKVLLERQRADEGAKLRKANNVMLKGKDQELEEVLADRDRLQAIVEERNTARLLAGDINIQAACPTLPEIEANIRRALTLTVSEWIKEVRSGLSAAIQLHSVLSKVFLEYLWLAQYIVLRHLAFMNGDFGTEGGTSEVDEATFDVFRQHVRRHHHTLFPLTGEHL